MIAVRLTRPWLIADLCRPMRVLSWAPVGAGYTMADHVVWREVRNADLPIGFDVERWFADEMAATYPGAIGMLTSRDIGTFAQGEACVEGVSAQCVATVGLTNGEAVGARRTWGPREFGTINIVVATDASLSEAAQLEALSIAVQARTAAVIAAGVSFETGPVTGTGTDCLALACLPGTLPYAGLHTPVGEAIGAAVKAAVVKGAESWVQWYQSASQGASE